MAVSKIKRTQEIASATHTGNTSSGGTINLSAVVSSNDLVLDVACTNSINALCLPWLYDNRIWFVKAFNWENWSVITNKDLNLIIKYVPNGRVQ